MYVWIVELVTSVKNAKWFSFIVRLRRWKQFDVTYSSTKINIPQTPKTTINYFFVTQTNRIGFGRTCNRHIYRNHTNSSSTAAAKVAIWRISLSLYFAFHPFLYRCVCLRRQVTLNWCSTRSILSESIKMLFAPKIVRFRFAIGRHLFDSPFFFISEPSNFSMTNSKYAFDVSWFNGSNTNKEKTSYQNILTVIWSTLTSSSALKFSLSRYEFGLFFFYLFADILSNYFYCVHLKYTKNSMRTYQFLKFHFRLNLHFSFR